MGSVFSIAQRLTISPHRPDRAMAFDGSEPAAPRPLQVEYPKAESVTAIEGGRIVTPAGTIEGGSVILRGDRIDRVRTEPAPLADRVIDARDRVVIPGIVDVHGDDYEHQLVPRTGARIDARTAFVATDRQNISLGITTKAHAIAFEDEHADHRSPAGAKNLLDVLQNSDGLLGTNVVHARFELSSIDPDTIAEVLANDIVVLASLMHHRPGEGQYEREEDFYTRYGADAGLGNGSVETLAEARSQAGDVWGDTAPRIVKRALAEDIPVASHDDDCVEAVDRAAACGIEICEFPLTRAAADRARDLGMATVMGAPNLIRGESLFDNLKAEDAIEAGACDVLCADYHPPSVLQSIFVETGEPLHERVARVTETPARMLGMSDRGRIAAGARADLLVVDPEPVARPTDVFVGGRPVLSQDPVADQ